MRLLLRRDAEIVALTADRKAGNTMASVFTHYWGIDLTKLVTVDELDTSAFDLAFCALPHATTRR